MRLIAFAKFSLLLLGFNANALAFFFDGSPPGVPNQAYAPPAKRPFISLAQYTQPGRPTAAADRFKRQVDGAVEVTKSLGPRATYDDLISALYADHYGYSAVDSVIMFRLTGNADYIDQAIHMVDLFVTSENAAIAVGSVPRIAADSYLDVGRYLSELSLTYDYGYERLSVQQRSAWRGLAEQTLYNIWNYSIASWGGKSRPWSGWSTNDPGNNYYYSFLHATQLWALAGQNRTWLNQLQSKNHRDLVSFFSQLNGGGSREGTGYGTSLGSLFENYAYWRDSSGEDLSAYSDHTRQTIDYWIFATVPTLQFFAPIGDQARSSMPVMFDYQRKLMLEAVALNPGTAQAGRGVWWLNRAQVTDGGDGWQTGSMHYAFNFRYDLLAIGKAEVAPTALTYDATGTGALFARSDWSKSASWMHLMAGPYDQSHAHQDQGSFSFFKGRWLAVSSNVHSRSGINQGTDVQNVVRFDTPSGPVPQNYGTASKVVTDTHDILHVSANLTPSYSNNAARISSWTRDFTYERSAHRLQIHDRCSVAAGVTPVWQLNLPVPPVRRADDSYIAGHLHIALAQPAGDPVTATVVNMHDLSSEFADGYRLELRSSGNSCEFNVTLVAQ